MTILETYTKQPIEVEIYAIQFSGDMDETDFIVSGHQVLTHVGKSLVTKVLSAPYTALLADDKCTIRTNASVTLPSNAPEGYVLYVGNTNQSAGIATGSFNIAARASIIVTMQSGAWVIEASAESIIVAAPNDQRMRLIMSGGQNKKNYKAELTITTHLGRTLQDELVIKIKDS